MLSRSFVRSDRNADILLFRSPVRTTVNYTLFLVRSLIANLGPNDYSRNSSTLVFASEVAVALVRQLKDSRLHAEQTKAKLRTRTVRPDHGIRP